MIFVLVFLLFWGRIYALDGPSFLENFDDSVIEDGSIKFACIGDEPIEWRFSGSKSACYEALKISKIENRKSNISRQSWKRHFSNITLSNASFLDVGRVECCYVNSNSCDSLYLFVNTSQHALLPCSWPDSKTCDLPVNDTVSEPVRIKLHDIKDFSPCRPTSPTIELEVKKDSDKLNATFDWKEGFQLPEVPDGGLEVTCGPKNHSEDKYCHMKVQIRKKCRVELNLEESQSQQVLTCTANCKDQLDDGAFELNLFKNETGKVEKPPIGCQNVTKTNNGTTKYATSCTFSLTEVSPPDGDYWCEMYLPNEDDTFTSAIKTVNVNVTASELSNRANDQTWIIATTVGVGVGLIFVFALLAVFIPWLIKQRNRGTVLKGLWQRILGEELSVPLVIPSMKTLGFNIFNTNRLSTNPAILDQIVAQSENEMASLRDVIEKLPPPCNLVGIDEKRLIFGEELGRGSFGIVRKAELGLSDPDCIMPVAVKGIRDSYDIAQYEALLSEIKLLASIGYQINIVNMYGIVAKNFEKKGELYMILEFCEGGSLVSFVQKHHHNHSFSNVDDFDYFTPTPNQSSFQDPYTRPNVSPGTLNDWNVVSDRNDNCVDSPLLTKLIISGHCGNEKLREKLSRRDLVIFAYQIANGMEFLHDRHCLHLDLAARNILVCSGNIVKISDLGLAKKVSDYDANYTPRERDDGQNKRQPPWKWMPPECLEFKSPSYGRKADIWAFGVLLWEMFTLGKDPYWPEFERCDQTFMEWLKSGERLPQPDSLKADEAAWVWDLITWCWKSAPESRPNFRVLKEEIRGKLPSETLKYYDKFNSISSQVLARIPEDAPPTPVPEEDEENVQTSQL